MIKNWESLEAECKKCRRCNLCDTRTNLVFGEGNLKSKIMFVGEGPGYNEDVQGRPFVGRSGKLLDNLLEEINLSREKIYISNIVKCRPPENRDPLPEEQEKCVNWLRNQVYIMRPKIIVTLGRIASLKIIDSEIKNHKRPRNFHSKKRSMVHADSSPCRCFEKHEQKARCPR